MFERKELWCDTCTTRAQLADTPADSHPTRMFEMSALHSGVVFDESTWPFGAVEANFIQHRPSVARSRYTRAYQVPFGLDATLKHGVETVLPLHSCERARIVFHDLDSTVMTFFHIGSQTQQQ